MAGTDAEVDLTGLDSKTWSQTRVFLHSAFRSIGLEATVRYTPAYPPNVRHVSIDGRADAFYYRLPSVNGAALHFLDAIGAVAGRTVASRCRRQVLEPVFIACVEMTEALEEAARELGARVVVARLPVWLGDCIERARRPFVRSAGRSLEMACLLLHDSPWDPTLALIAADRAVEVLLKGRLAISSERFPRLLARAQQHGLLDASDARTLQIAHRTRNRLQHDGDECSYEYGLDTVRDIIDVFGKVVVARKKPTG